MSFGALSLFGLLHEFRNRLRDADELNLLAPCHAGKVRALMRMNQPDHGDFIWLGKGRQRRDCQADGR